MRNHLLVLGPDHGSRRPCSYILNLIFRVGVSNNWDILGRIQKRLRHCAGSVFENLDLFLGRIFKLLPKT